MFECQAVWCWVSTCLIPYVGTNFKQKHTTQGWSNWILYSNTILKFLTAANVPGGGGALLTFLDKGVPLGLWCPKHWKLLPYTRLNTENCWAAFCNPILDLTLKIAECIPYPRPSDWFVNPIPDQNAQKPSGTYLYTSYIGVHPLGKCKIIYFDMI